jgi:predicted DNA binding CopG/RHH family protein
MSNINSRNIASPDDVVLDAYEQKLEDSLDLSKIKKHNLSEQDKMDWAEAARRHAELKKSKRITLSVSVGELLKFRAKAEEKGIPYQTLMNVMIKQYNDGEISVGL